MVGEGICRRAYWQAQVQCSDARDLSAPLTLHLGAHFETHAQSLAGSPFLCQVLESSHEVSSSTSALARPDGCLLC